MAFRTPEEEYAALFGLPQPVAPAPDYAGVGVDADPMAQVPEFQPEPEPLLPDVVLPDQLGPDLIDGLPYGSRVERLPTTIQEVQPGQEYPPGVPPTIDNQLARAGQSAGAKTMRSSGESQGTSSATPQIVRKKMGRLGIDQGEVDAAVGRRAEGIAQGSQARIDAERGMAEAEAGVLGAQATAKEQVADFDLQEAEAEAVFTEAANQAATEKIQGISNAIEAVRTMKVDPQRMWNDGGNMHKAAGLVSAFIGGFLQPVLGQNTIQQTIDRAIDRDIAAQKSDIAGAQANVANLRTLHSLGLQQAETEAEQRTQDRLMRKASLLGGLEAQVMGMQDPVLRAKAEQEIGNIKADFAKQVDEIGRQEQARVFNEMKTRRQLQLQSQEVAISRRRQETSARRQALDEAKYADKRRQMAKDAMDAEAAKQLPITTGFSIGGNRMTIQDDTERRKLRSTSQALNNQYASAEALKQMEMDHLRIPGSSDRLQANAMMSNILTSQGESIARSSDKDMQIFMHKFGGDTDKFFNLASDEELDAVLSSFQAHIKQQGTFAARAFDERAVWEPDPDVTAMTVTSVLGGDEKARRPSLDRQIEVLDTPEEADQFMKDIRTKDLRPGDPKILEAINIFGGTTDEQRAAMARGETVNIPDAKVDVDADIMRELFEYANSGTPKFQKIQAKKDKRSAAIEGFRRQREGLK